MKMEEIDLFNFGVTLYSPAFFKDINSQYFWNWTNAKPDMLLNKLWLYNTKTIFRAWNSRKVKKYYNHILALKEQQLNVFVRNVDSALSLRI